MHSAPITLRALEAAIRESWSAETAWTPSVWSSTDPAAGQCWSTAYVIRSLLGGEIIHAEVLPHTSPKQRHSWNRFPSGFDVDLTREQFASDQQFRECSLSEELIMSISGSQAELLHSRVVDLLRGPGSTSKVAVADRRSEQAGFGDVGNVAHADL